jgi:ribose transport system permease protein
MGMAAAIVSMTIGGRLQSAIPTNGSGYELQFIIAAVLGGTGFAGTGGNVFGTLLGSLVLAVFSNGLNLLGINSYLIQILQGIVIIAAIVSAFAYSKKKT